MISNRTDRRRKRGDYIPLKTREAVLQDAGV